MIVTKTDQKANKIQASFPEYTGKKIFLVRHPDYQSGGGYASSLQTRTQHCSRLRSSGAADGRNTPFMLGVT